MTNSADNNSNANGNGHGQYQPGEVYENLDGSTWMKTDPETEETELLFSDQLPEEIKPDQPEDDEDDEFGDPSQFNPRRN